MSVSERSETAVHSSLQRFEKKYNGFEIVKKTWEHPPDQYRRIVERFEHETLGGAGVWLTNDAGEVLLVRNEGDTGWSDPGGKREVGETYEATARREVREETGLECELTGLCEVHIIQNQNAEAERAVVFEIIAIFQGKQVGGNLRPREGEIAEVGWFTTPPQEVLYREVKERPYPASGYTGEPNQ